MGREYETDNRLHDVLDRNRDPAFIFSAGRLLGGGSDCVLVDCGLLPFLRMILSQKYFHDMSVNRSVKRYFDTHYYPGLLRSSLKSLIMLAQTAF